MTGFKQGEGGTAVSGGAGPSGNTANATPSGNAASGNAPTLEKCDKPLGTLAVSEPQDYVMHALQQQGLGKPNSLIRIMVQQSNCFMVVERGVAMQNIQQERALAESGQLRKDSNMGKGQLATADYVMTTEVVFKNNNAGGVGGSAAAVGSMFGVLGAIGGAVVGGLKFQEAQTTLTVADTRSGIQVAAATGASQKGDWALGGLLGGGGAALGLGAYENTAEGKVVAMAFLDAYNNVVKAVRGSGEMQRTNATLKEEAGKAVKAGEVAGGGDVFTPKINGIQMLSKPDAKASIVEKLTKGGEVIATGQEDGEFIKVQSSSGKEGWVKKAMLKKSGS